MLDLALAVLSTPLEAEGIFFKDGSIIEGTILRETDTGLVAKISGKGDIAILRARVLRVVCHDQYKKAVEVRKSDGSRLKGYIVDENRDDYIMRPVLDSPAEITIKKNEVKGILTTSTEKQASPKASSKPTRASVTLAVFSSTFPAWSGV